MLIASLLGMLVGVIFARIVAEFILIVFRINEHLGAIRNRGEMYATGWSVSRAFVKEPDGGEPIEPLPDRPISPHPNFVTPEGLALIDSTACGAV